VSVRGEKARAEAVRLLAGALGGELHRPVAIEIVDLITEHVVETVRAVDQAEAQNKAGGAREVE
jgi:hypothetical protein